jgi:RHS repeat-associated protein
MSDKSNSASAPISIPKGGGAMHGIGEKFSPDLHTGTGNFTVPIALPPGRNGFQPQLSLTYSTGNGNGPFGLGWSLSVPGVIRKTSHGIPRYRDDAESLDEQDTYILSGAEDLVPVGGAPAGATRYRPRTEGLFAQIDRFKDNGGDYWRVRSKDGLVSAYGTEQPANAGTDWQDPAVVRNPDPLKHHHIFAWKLTKTQDTFGNTIIYEYLRDTAEEGPRHWDQLYLKRIRYADYSKDGNVEYLVSVEFFYDHEIEATESLPVKSRPDPFSEYRAGFEIRTRRRCKRILIKTHADRERLVRAYDLTYFDEREERQAMIPLNHASLLSLIEVIGFDDNSAAAKELPPLEFSYTQFTPLTQRGRDFYPVQGADLPATSLANRNLALVDLFGSGLPDILEMNGVVRYWRNLGEGRFDRPRTMRDAPAGLAFAAAGVQFMDANGNGRSDLLVTQGTLSGYFPLSFDGRWDRKSFRRYRQAPSFNLEDPEVALVDLDGDGVTDAIRSGSRLECFFSDPEDGWNETRFVERRALEEFPNVNFSDPRIKWADMCGDGLQDIVRVYDGKVEYWPNLGYGAWGKRVRMSNSPRLPLDYDPRRILLGDVDGDGLADLIYVDNGKITLCVNRGGNAWSDPIEIRGTPRISDMDAVRLADLLGSGVSGVLWTRDATLDRRDHYFFLDLTGGAKPYLLNEMNNHLGAVTRVEYAPSTKFYLEDQKRQQTRWKTTLPFPVQVVACVEVIDEISRGKLTTEYRYHHGYWDGREREFRGFGMVEQLDTESFEQYDSGGLHGAEVLFAKVDRKYFSAPTLTKTWFHQGPVEDASGEWREQDMSAEYWEGDPPLLSHTESVNSFLSALSDRDSRRDALRALRSSVLRTELYALDGDAREDRPYTVTEQAYGLREEADPTDERPERPRIFFPHLLAQRTTQWERGDDPMTQIAISDDYDAYGQPRRQITIAVPRGRNPRVDGAAGEPYLITQTETTYANRDDARRYLIGRVSRTTSYEILNDGSPAWFRLYRQIIDGNSARRLIGQTLNFYDGPAFEGLSFGQLGDHGALARTESLALTEEILRDAYKSGATAQTPPETPPYLAPGESGAWTAEYPQEFRDLTPPLAGYIFQPGGADSQHARGYFVVAERRRYDCQDSPDGTGRGLLVATRDPLGRDTAITYDEFNLLPTQVIDPAGLKIQATYDYRVLQPREVTDPNGNRSAVTFTPMGLVTSAAIMGKVGESAGDTLETPGARMIYDFRAFVERGQPASVRSIRRIHHANGIDVAAPERDETIESVEYSDGFGRLLQTRAQAEDVVFGAQLFGDAGLPVDQSLPHGDAAGRQRAAGEASRVLVSGWQIYDNKGRVVEKFEPFFSVGFDYAAPTDAEFGQKATMFYDPRGRVIRTLNPDGSEQRVIFGVPPDLTKPDTFSPTPWESFTYDANDNAGRTHPAGAAGYQQHWDTPASIVVDALGRTVTAVARNGSDPTNDWFVTSSTYDIRGNLLTVTDPLGRVAFRHVYDLANRPLRAESIDAGLRRTVPDALGNPIERRDSKGAVALHGYDALHRPIRVWARDGAGQPVTLRERIVYGDAADAGISREQAIAANLLGKLHKHYDEAGLLLVEGIDFKGNLLEKTRQVIADAPIVAAFNPPPQNWQIPAFRVDWQPPAGKTLNDHAGALLDAMPYRTSAAYDALNRVTLIRYPQDVNGQRKALRPHYNRAGVLERVELDGVSFVERIAYNAKGQRLLIAYGAGVMTRYAYDPHTFRLARLRSERYTKPTPHTYRPSGAPLQDFAYQYDLAGNITAIAERTPGSGIANTPLGIDALDRVFTYDPLYRLLSANGREHDSPAPEPWDAQPRGADLTRVRAYTERYQYDRAGNLLQLQHVAGSGGFARQLALSPDTNRLATVTLGETVYPYTYDANGNLIRETTSRHFEWDHADRMRVFRTQAGEAEPSVHATYLYDAAGERTKKLVRKQGGQIEVTIYIDGLFDHQCIVQGNTIHENNTLHVIDDQSRVAVVLVGAPFPNDTTPAVKFHFSDHLGSSHMVIDDSGAFINREEYTPYGEHSFGSFGRKRYRFTGKERDEESGLYYHSARYYAPWLARWTSSDPIGLRGGVNLYQYVLSNPVRLVDPTGLGPKEDLAKAVGELHERADKIDVDITVVENAKPGEKIPSTLKKSTNMSIEEVKGAVKDARSKLEGQIEDLKRKFKPTIEELERASGGGGYRSQEPDPVLLEFKRLVETHKNLKARVERLFRPGGGGRGGGSRGGGGGRGGNSGASSSSPPADETPSTSGRAATSAGAARPTEPASSAKLSVAPRESPTPTPGSGWAKGVRILGGTVSVLGHAFRALTIHEAIEAAKESNWERAGFLGIAAFSGVVVGTIALEFAVISEEPQPTGMYVKDASSPSRVILPPQPVWY